MTARNDAITLSKRWASTCSPSAPMARLEIVTPSCIAEMKRGGSLVIRTHRSRAPVAFVLELQDARSPRRDEAVFGRDEERVHQDEAGERQHLEEEGHRARSRRRQSRHRRSLLSSVKPTVIESAPRARAYWAADRRPRESVAGV